MYTFWQILILTKQRKDLNHIINIKPFIFSQFNAPSSKRQ